MSDTTKTPPKGHLTVVPALEEPQEPSKQTEPSLHGVYENKDFGRRPLRLVQKVQGLPNTYQVQGDPEFYQRFVNMTARLLVLGSLFQHGEIVVDAESVVNWDTSADEVFAELELLLAEADTRVMLTK